MSELNRNKAIKDIKKAFAHYRAVRGLSPDEKDILQNLCDEKMYEYHCVAKWIEYLACTLGYKIELVGTVELHIGGRNITPSTSYFHITNPNSKVSIDWKMYTNLWIRMQGSPPTGGDRSGHHEIDIVILENVQNGFSGLPLFNQIIGNVECKSGKFKKSFVREAIGIKREIAFATAFFTREPGPRPASFIYREVESIIYRNSPKPRNIHYHLFRCTPSVESYLWCLDGDCKHYIENPRNFGILVEQKTP